ncbi:AAA family ATPase [Candidatus Micrarchaeota archaeon]|nr:AAA family ATPase [Candidatus Micrarchaeota archaeon]
MVLERVKTGIEGLDKMLNGGIPARRHVALYGGPGCGKTSFGFEYIYRGAKAGENGVYITLEETPDEILDNMRNTFPMMSDVDSLMEENKMEIAKPDKLGIEGVAEILEDRIVNNEAKRVVIDSLTIVKVMTRDIADYRQTLFEFLSLLRNLDCTTITTVEASKISKESVEYEIEHFVMDGIINLYNLDRGDKRIRALEIFKMRGTKHSRDLVPFKVTPSGIKVYVGEKVF